jgi:hypothetical protein
MSDKMSVIKGVIKRLEKKPVVQELVGKIDKKASLEADISYDSLMALGLTQIVLTGDKGRVKLKIYTRRSGSSWESDYIELYDMEGNKLHVFPGSMPIFKQTYY